MQPRLLLFPALLCIALGYMTLGVAQDRITIDEDFSDWYPQLPSFTDGVDNPNALDLLEMQASNDAEYLYVKFSIDGEVCLGNTLVAHTLWLSIDADNNPNTGFAEQAGYGTELAINFNGHYAWFNVPNPNVQVSFGELGLQMAPTVTSSTFEVAIPRNIKPDGIHDLFSGDTIRLVINDDRAGDRMPNAGMIFSYVFQDTLPNGAATLALNKDDPNHIRAIAYNVLRDNAWSPSGLPHLERIVKALDGDLYCFQESGQTAALDAKSYFDSWLPLNTSKGWSVYKDDGRLTLSRWPIGTSWDLVRKTAMIIDLPSTYARDLLLVNGHLSCCQANQSRQDQADEFASFVLDAKSPGAWVNIPESTPIMFMGDMNLVGYRQQLETILTGDIQDVNTYGAGGALDWDSTDLADAVPLHIDSNLVFTWRPLSGNGFPPGRLDFQFYTDAVLEKKKAFVLQTETMNSKLLSKYQLQSGDTEISDHLPLVVDYAFDQTITTIQHQPPKVDLKLYPNPTHGMLKIDTRETIEEIVVSDLLGRELILAKEGARILDVSSLAPGGYWVKIKLAAYEYAYTYKIEVK